jgi:hypothetical protein
MIEGWNWKQIKLLQKSQEQKIIIIRTVVEILVTKRVKL